jgi:hypothetical protein
LHTPQIALGNFFEGVKRSQAIRHPKNPRCTPGIHWFPFQGYSEGTKDHWFSLGKITNDIMTHCTQVIGFLIENGETEALAALSRFDIARLNEVMAAFT